MSTSAITPSTTGPTSSTASSAASAALGSASQLGPDSFMTLLVAQLQNQDPSNPMDPTTMVSQLVDFNSLEQLIQINQNTTPAGGTQSTSNTTSSSGVTSTAVAAAQSATNLNVNTNSLSTNSQANS